MNTELQNARRAALIVSRHPATIEWLREQGFTGDVMPSVTRHDVYNRVVVGNLPIHLAASCRTVGAVSLPESAPRGEELSLEYITENAVLKWFTVSDISDRFAEPDTEEARRQRQYAGVGEYRTSPLLEPTAGGFQKPANRGSEKWSPEPLTWATEGDGADGPDDE